MNHILQDLRSELERRVTAALSSKSMSNRGTLPPFRLPRIAQSLVAGLLVATSDDATTEARVLGASLAQQGLALSALLEAQIVSLVVVAEAKTTPDVTEHVGRYFSHVVESFGTTEAQEVDRQRAEMERAYIKATREQREQEELLRLTIRELSTPIIPVHDGILVLALVGSIDSRRASEITERLLEAIAEQQAELVIIDITGVPVIDTSTANHLLTTTRAASLLGSQIILVGLSAEIAQTIVHIGIELRGLITLANLGSGLAYALEQRGLSIQPLNHLRK